MPPSGGYNPKVFHPEMSNNIPQMRSSCFQKPFFFGGSQVPVNLGLSKQSYSGAGFVGDAPPKRVPIFRNEGRPNYQVLSRPNIVGSGGGASSQNRGNGRIDSSSSHSNNSSYSGDTESTSSSNDENRRRIRRRPRSRAERPMHQLEELIINNGEIMNSRDLLGDAFQISNYVHFLPNNIVVKMYNDQPVTIDEYNLIRRILWEHRVAIPNYFDVT
jgi:hypothetical protein